MPRSTNRKVAVTLGVALSALAVVGSIAIDRIWQDQQPLLGTLVLVLVSVVSAMLVAESSSVRKDIERSAQAHQALRASEARMAGLVGVAADAIISVDGSGRITLFNHGAEQIFGYGADEMLGRELSVLLPQRFRGAHGGHMAGFAASTDGARRMGERRAISGLRKNGAEFPADASILKLAVEGELTFTVVMRDITERKRVEEAQRFLADAGGVLTRTIEIDEALALVAQLPVPRMADVCVLDLADDGGRMRRVASLSDDPALNARLAAIMGDAPGPDAASAVVDVLRSRQSLLVETVTDEWIEAHSETPDLLERQRAVGATSLILVPLVARGEALGVMTVISVRPDRRYGADDVALAEQLAERAAFAIDNARLFGRARAAASARDDMLGVVSHDLRNPVNAIGMCVRALRENPPESVQARNELVHAIAEAADWMDRLIRDLLDVASIESGRLEIVCHREDVRPIVDSAIAMFARGAEARAVHLSHAVPDGIPALNVDAARLLQVLANLLANALAHTDAGGSIALSVSEQASEVTFTVRDSGSGIPADELPHIFERHWRGHASARKGGSGLGLAISRGIVVAHGGRIWVESEPGAGSAFHLSLPTS